MLRLAAILAGPLLALLAPPAAALQLAEGPAAGSQDVSGPQEEWSSSSWQVGDHVLVEKEEGSGKVWVKGSIEGKGADSGSYNVHLWVGNPRHRDLTNVPVDRLVDARAVEQIEAEQARAQELDERREAQEKERLRREQQEQAEREAKEKLRLEEEQRREYERQLAEQEAAAERKNEEERLKYAESFSRDQAQKEDEKHQLQLTKLKAARREKAKAGRDRPALGQELERLETELKQKEKQKAEADEKKKKVSYKNAKVRLRVRDTSGREAQFDVPRTKPMKVMMHVAAERLGLDPPRSNFFVQDSRILPSDTVGHRILPSDTLGQLKMKNNDVILVRGPPKAEDEKPTRASVAQRL
mmetsp:Transcript_103826/g.293604  ORF Transcript_103826/g.293604 Transcript_103826/m.293604 type:complete len:356 (-) Transcript_103826:63-1130(-)